MTFPKTPDQNEAGASLQVTGGELGVQRIAVLLSGRGSNFLAIHQAIDRGDLPAKIVLVVSNVSSAPGLAKARALGLQVLALPHRKELSRASHEGKLLEALRAVEAEWVCLAGYMRLLSGDFVRHFHQRVLNIHPSLLPAFPGLRAQEQALKHGVRVTGCTVHFVDEELDNGPIIVQKPVAVMEDDTVSDLSRRLLREEHEAYPEALKRLFLEPWEVSGRRVLFGSKETGEDSRKRLKKRG
ncbi:MAG: phosphoribosylglycinamide formyltransferase [Deltaproteobacteria bacterium]|nr:phosphoribosylglycinamide formyltransferase [Deltaproteobacteria bacterium]